MLNVTIAQDLMGHGQPASVSKPKPRKGSHRQAVTDEANQVRNIED